MNLQALFEPKTMAVIGVSLTNNRHPANVICNQSPRYQQQGIVS